MVSYDFIMMGIWGSGEAGPAKEYPTPSGVGGGWGKTTIAAEGKRKIGGEARWRVPAFDQGTNPSTSGTSFWSEGREPEEAIGSAE